jgi:serine/threonine-protein kinase HipA
MKSKLVVWWQGQVVGELVKREGGKVQFAYSPAWLADPAAPPLSASLSKVSEPYSVRSTMAFFNGLLPEGRMREAMAKSAGVSKLNAFGLLDSAGGDVAGAIQLLPEGEAPSGLVAGSTRPLSDEAMLRLIDELPMRPMLAGEKGLRLSLAGAQAKAAVVLVDGRVAKPAAGQPTTHILKPAIIGLDGIVENEAFCMRLAKVIGLDAAAVEPITLQLPNREPRKYLLVERYDRALIDGVVVRLHQEDFCQALGLPVEKKYQAEGGPGFPACFDLIDKVSREPAKDRIRLLDAAVFNVMVGNSDAHAKNFSFLYAPLGKGGVRLAPLYDILSTSRYVGDNIDQRFAMKIGHARTLEQINPKEWRHFAEGIGVTHAYLRSRVLDLAEKVRAAVDGVAFDFEHCNRDFLRDLAAEVSRRAQLCVAKCTA